MLPGWSIVGFKEWAVTVAALEKGEQVILLRKGGIREDGKHFKVEHEGFFLYPTYDHQKSELVKTECHDLYNSTLIDEDPDLVHLSSYAEVTEVIETTDDAIIESLDHHHIWTQEYAAKRLRWKPKVALTAMVLRVYRLPAAKHVPFRPEYVGCKSWLPLLDAVTVDALEPAMADAAFAAEANAIEAAMKSATVPPLQSSSR